MAEETKNTNPKINLSIDFRMISILLWVVIVVMLFIWKPWSGNDNSDRTISVTGESTISAEPDEYVFYPMYQFKNANSEAALASLTKKSNMVVAGLKNLGVTDNQIKTNSGGYDYGYPISVAPDGQSTMYSLNLTVTVNNRELAQKVQNYLLTTKPTGAVSPTAQFSDAKRSELESRARDEATKDARAKAEQSATNIGFKIGKVKSVTDGSGFGDIYPMIGRGAVAEDSVSSKQMTIQPGENKLNYSVTVVYFVK